MAFRDHVTSSSFTGCAVSTGSHVLLTEAKFEQQRGNIFSLVNKREGVGISKSFFLSKIT